MRRGIRHAFFALLFAACAGVTWAQQGTPQAAAPAAPAVTQRIEAQVRRLYALGPSFQVRAKEPKPTPIEGILQVEVEVTLEGQTDTVAFYATRDARFLLRGELIDTAGDPFAQAKSLITTDNSPSKGPANAKVTVVEYSDFQCPTCRAMSNVLRSVVPLYPNVRFVFRDFPLVQIHPWAETAHKAARCAYKTSPASFWKMHDAIFDRQEIISPATVYTTMLDLAAQAGANPDAVRACMATPDVQAEIQAGIAEGMSLKIANTPTTFVNGRRVIGADRQTLEQMIQYELAATGSSAGAGARQPGTPAPKSPAKAPSKPPTGNP